MNIIDLSNLAFKSTDKDGCKEELKKARWSNGFVCPACGHNKAYELRSRPVFECANKTCKRQTSATAGTQFHNTRTLEKLWPVVRNNLSNAVQLSRSSLRQGMVVCFETARRAQSNIARGFKVTVGDEKSTVQDRKYSISIFHSSKNKSEPTVERNSPQSHICACDKLHLDALALLLLNSLKTSSNPFLWEFLRDINRFSQLLII